MARLVGARTMEHPSGDLDRGRKDDVGTNRGTSKDMIIFPLRCHGTLTTTVLGGQPPP
jgi:hypothetical protein